MSKRKRTLCIAAVVLLLMNLCSAHAVIVDYNRPCSVQIHMETSPLRPTWDGLVFSLYRIGDIDNSLQDMTLVFSGPFTALGTEITYSTAQEQEALARQVERFIQKQGTAPVARAQTDADGKAAFDGLEPGVYFGSLSLGYGVSAIPFILPVPFFEAGTLTYDPIVVPKAEIVPQITPTPTPTPVGDLPMTGLNNTPVIILGGIGALFLVIGVLALLLCRKEKKKA